jgi:hypothetical protein
MAGPDEVSWASNLDGGRCGNGGERSVGTTGAQGDVSAQFGGNMKNAGNDRLADKISAIGTLAWRG